MTVRLYDVAVNRRSFQGDCDVIDATNPAGGSLLLVFCVLRTVVILVNDDSNRRSDSQNGCLLLILKIYPGSQNSRIKYIRAIPKKWYQPFFCSDKFAHVCSIHFDLNRHGP